ncbi:MAG: small multi-drug export protein [Syntrophales bacterium]|jgi:uncharacterized membrane protein|nr:small multi-drug export protein [Syntrophales bacterium]MDY0045360.1 small multi-drug export protein [Syntrophales bacterium]
MRYIKKLFLLLYSLLKKLVIVIKTHFILMEVKILVAGLAMTFFAGLYLVYLFFADPDLYKTLVSTALIHIMGGRALGIATCLSAGIPLLKTIFCNLYLEIVIVLIAYSIVVLFMRNVLQPKLFHKAVRQAELTAQSQKTRIKKYGAVGLFIFVMFPFFMTGPVIGSIIGYLLNYRAINNFLIVFGGTFTSIIVYALLGNRMLKFINSYIQVDTVKTWGATIAAMLILIFLIYHLKTIRQYVNKNGSKKETGCE